MDKNDVKKQVASIFKGYGLEGQHLTMQADLCRFINQFGDDRFVEGFDSAIKFADDIPEEIGGTPNDDDEF